MQQLQVPPYYCQILLIPKLPREKCVIILCALDCPSLQTLVEAVLLLVREGHIYDLPRPLVVSAVLVLYREGHVICLFATPHAYSTRATHT